MKMCLAENRHEGLLPGDRVSVHLRHKTSPDALPSFSTQGVSATIVELQGERAEMSLTNWIPQDPWRDWRLEPGGRWWVRYLNDRPTKDWAKFLRRAS